MSEQLQFGVDNSDYLRALDFARVNRENQEFTQKYLERWLSCGLSRTDLQTIWRAVYRSWETPFDVR